MRNFFKWIGILVLVLVFLFVFFPNLFLRVPEPVRSGILSLSELEASVTVYFDEYAVPHIYAEGEHDLFFAAGYVMASERLFQMDMTNRAIQGRLAEMDAGLVNADKYLRTWGFHHIGRQMAAAMDPESRQIIQWACDGINAYIDSHRDNLPLEFKLAGHQPLYWDPSITCGFDRLMGRDLNSAWRRELAISFILEILDERMAGDLFPVQPPMDPLMVPPSSVSYFSLLEAIQEVQRDIRGTLGNITGLKASNNWAVSGARTGDHPFLANDMHLGYSQPPVWYEMHLVGGRFNVRGVCFPGVPLIMSGNNEHIAWGPTNVEADDSDFYTEEVNPRDSTTYLYKGEWLPFTVREEVIQVKGAEPVTFTVRETVHGVIINDFHDIARRSELPIAMRWTGQDISDEATAFLRLNLASNWEEFSAAAALFTMPGQNMIYADREGNIGWRPFVRVPIRKGGASLRVLPGASGEYDWQGYVPFEEMPYLYNPLQGYIATANHRTVSDDFPYYITHYWATPYRIRRISELLEASDEHDMETLMAVQTDVLSVRARELVPVLLAAYEDPATRGDLSLQVSAALELLRQWDFVMDGESAAAAVFVAWVEHLKEAIYRDEMDRAGENVYSYYLRTGFPSKSIAHLLLQKSSPWFDDVNTPEIEDLNAVVRRALGAAVDELREQSGKRVARWTWGRLHTLTHPHALAGDGALGRFLNWWLDLNVGPFSMPGSWYTVNAIAHSSQDPFISTFGPSERSIIDLSDLDNSRIVLPTGQSGNPFSRHYDDQAELYNAGRYRPVHFSREVVERDAASIVILQPE